MCTTGYTINPIFSANTYNSFPCLPTQSSAFIASVETGSTFVNKNLSQMNFAPTPPNAKVQDKWAV